MEHLYPRFVLLGLSACRGAALGPARTSGVYAPARQLAPQGRTGIAHPNAAGPGPAQADAGHGSCAGHRVGGEPQRGPNRHQWAGSLSRGLDIEVRPQGNCISRLGPGFSSASSSSASIVIQGALGWTLRIQFHEAGAVGRSGSGRTMAYSLNQVFALRADVRGYRDDQATRCPSLARSSNQ